MQGGVRKKGDTWYYYFDLAKVGGKRKKIERKGGKTKKEALEALRKAITEYELGGSIVKSNSSMSFSDYLDYWYNSYVIINCKYNTQLNYRTVIDKHLKPALGLFKLNSLNPEQLQHFLNNKMINGFSKNSVGNFYGVLSGSLKYAVYPLKYINNNPMQFVKMPKYSIDKVNTDNLKIISIEEWNKIINRFPKGSPEYIPLQIAFHTGMRSGEVLGLTWDCIDFNNKTIRIEKILIDKGKGVFELGSPKTDSSYGEIVIGDILINILKEHKEWQNKNKNEYGSYYTDNNFVCTKQNGKQVTTSVIKYLSRIVNYELGIKFNFHSLRHTHATMLLAAGANIKDIQKRLRHSRLSTTMDTYSHVTKELSTSTVNIFESLLS